MKRIAINLMLFTFFSLSAHAQSFTTVDELIQLSKMDPLESEKLLTSKGFVFIETDGLESEYSKFSEGIKYTISPRRVHYATLQRNFFLAASSRLTKSGFVLTNSEGTLEDDGRTIKAQQYKKGEYVVWLFIDKDNDETNYHVQVDNNDPSKSAPSSTTSSTPSPGTGYKEDVNYGYFFVGLILPRGVIAEDPKPNTTYSEDFSGLSGIGAKPGFEFGIGGVLGITPLNRKLPYFLDFGILLNGQYGVQPYSYKSLGAPFDDYTYSGFMRGSAGAGPALILTPFRDSDFHLSFYYKPEAALNFSGGFDYSGTEGFDQTATRDAVSFAWVKSYGIHIYGGGIFGGIEFLNYTDKGTFNLHAAGFNPNTNSYEYSDSKINAALPVRQINLKIGFAF